MSRLSHGDISIRYGNISRLPWHPERRWHVVLPTAHAPYDGDGEYLLVALKTNSL